MKRFLALAFFLLAGIGFGALVTKAIERALTYHIHLTITQH